MVRRSFAVALVAASAVVLPAAPAAAQDDACDGVGPESTPVTKSDSRSAPYDRLHLAEAHALLAARPGRPAVAVAVLDSPMRSTGLIGVAPGAAVRPGQAHWHGTAVAGLIAARPRSSTLPTGVAPGVRVIGVPVWNPEVEEGGPSSEAVAQGLNWVADNAAAHGIKVANVSLSVGPSEALRQAVSKARARGVLVVASAGDRNRNQTGGGGQAFVPGSGEDAATQVYPAGYDEVLAVSSLAPDGVDPREAVLQNSQTDIAAPTAGAVTVSANGGTCMLGSISSDWAAAEVSGIAALVASAYPSDGPAQLAARLVHTAAGHAEAPTVLAGAGMVQVVEALTTPLTPDAAGTVPKPREEDRREAAAAIPEPPEDPLAETRREALWWGLAGGVGLVVVLLLGPLVRRRREAD